MKFDKSIAFLIGQILRVRVSAIMGDSGSSVLDPVQSQVEGECKRQVGYNAQELQCLILVSYLLQ